MATITTRSMSGLSNHDVAAIKVDADTYKDKWGIIELNLTSYDWASGTSVSLTGMGTVDIRVPQYNVANDTPVLDKVTLNSTDNTGAVVAISKKYYFAINNGVIGPAAFPQPDGTWDLMYIKFDQVDTTTALNAFNVSVVYTITFTDLTPNAASNPTTNGNLTLSVDNDSKLSDKSTVTQVSSTLATHSGYITHQLIDLTSTMIDIPPGFVGTPSPTDSVPLFAVVNTPTPIGFGQAAQLCMHPLSKRSGVKTYFKRMFLWAVNSGKVDGNGNNVNTSAPYASLVDYQLAKVQEWPCDDLVTIVATHYTTWTQMV